jgi:hypothetical protein
MALIGDFFSLKAKRYKQSYQKLNNGFMKVSRIFPKVKITGFSEIFTRQRKKIGLRGITPR